MKGILFSHIPPFWHMIYRVHIEIILALLRSNKLTPSGLKNEPMVDTSDKDAVIALKLLDLINKLKEKAANGHSLDHLSDTLISSIQAKMHQIHARNGSFFQRRSLLYIGLTRALTCFGKSYVSNPISPYIDSATDFSSDTIKAIADPIMSHNPLLNMEMRVEMILYLICIHHNVFAITELPQHRMTQCQAMQSLVEHLHKDAHISFETKVKYTQTAMTVILWSIHWDEYHNTFSRLWNVTGYGSKFFLILLSFLSKDHELQFCNAVVEKMKEQKPATCLHHMWDELHEYMVNTSFLNPFFNSIMQKEMFQQISIATP